MTFADLELQQAIDFVAESGGTFAADDDQIHPENHLFQVGAFDDDDVCIGAAIVERLADGSTELAAIATTEPGVTGPLIVAAQGQAAEQGLILSIAKVQGKIQM